jgi:hypothetical protein
MFLQGILANADYRFFFSGKIYLQTTKIFIRIVISGVTVCFLHKYMYWLKGFYIVVEELLVLWHYSWIFPNWRFLLHILYTGLVPSIAPETSLSVPSSRFCFETMPYLTPCTCETSITSCTENPCLTDVCPSYPEAICHVDFCSECKSTWYYNNQEVDCLEDRGRLLCHTTCYMTHNVIYIYRLSKGSR